MLTFETLEENIINYHYPYGTDLTLADLVQEGGNAPVRLELTASFPDGTDHTYVLRVVPGTTLGESTKDGEPWDFSILGYEYPLGGDLDILEVENPLFQTYWFDAVLREHAQAHLAAASAANPASNDNRFGGTDLTSQLNRVEKNIVEFDDRYVAIGSLYGRGGIKTWLEQHTPHQSRGWEFYRVDNSLIPQIEGKDYLILESVNTDADHGPDDPKITYPIHAITADATADDYTLRLTREGEEQAVRPYLGFRLDGQDITHFNSFAVLSYDRAAPLLTPALDEDFEDGVWLAVRAPGLPMVLLLPPDNAILHLYIDQDGAMTVLEVCNFDYTHLDLQKTEMFNRRWGAYLDENTVIPEDALAADIAALHAELEEGR